MHQGPDLMLQIVWKAKEQMAILIAPAGTSHCKSVHNWWRKTMKKASWISTYWWHRFRQTGVPRFAEYREFRCDIYVACQQPWNFSGSLCCTLYKQYVLATNGWPKHIHSQYRCVDQMGTAPRSRVNKTAWRDSDFFIINLLLRLHPGVIQWWDRGQIDWKAIIEIRNYIQKHTDCRKQTDPDVMSKGEKWWHKTCALYWWESDICVPSSRC